MKKTILSAALVLAAALSWAQTAPIDEEKVVPPTLEEVNAKVDSVEDKALALNGSQTEKNEALSSRIKALESRIKIGGYLAAALQYNVDTATIGFYDASPENTRFRLNFDYADGAFSFKSRLQYRPLKATATTATNAPYLDWAELAYFQGSVSLWNNLVKLNAGRLKSNDFALFSYYQADTVGAANYDGIATTSDGLELQVRPLPELTLGVTVPVELPSAANSYATSFDVWSKTAEKIDVAVAYKVKGMFNASAGLLGGKYFLDMGKNGAAFSDFFKLGFAAAGSANYLNTAYASFAWLGTNNLTVGLQYLHTYNYNYLFSVVDEINLTAGYAFGDFSVTEDLSLRLFAADRDKHLVKDDDAMIQTSTSFKYLLKDALDKGVNLEPGLNIRSESRPDVSNAPGAVFAYQNLSINPRVKILAGKQELLIGYEYFMITDNNQNKFLDSKDKDQDIHRVHVGYKINF